MGINIKSDFTKLKLKKTSMRMTNDAVVDLKISNAKKVITQKGRQSDSCNQPGIRVFEERLRVGGEGVELRL